jgi:hypothetical protein
MLEDPVEFTRGSRVQFDYTNYRGETSRREAVVIALQWGGTEWHPEPQPLLLAHDLGKGQDRQFAICDIKNLIFTKIVPPLDQSVTAVTVSRGPR